MVFNNIEKIWITEAGLEAVVLITKHVGHRCGYVRVPKGHKHDGEHYDYLGYINVHGGLTYSSESEKFTLSSRDNGTWFGFDCGHYNDASDWEALKALCETDAEFNEVIRLQELMGFTTQGEIRTLEFCVNECEKLASCLNSKVED